ncbi:MAG: DinB family protein [Planctomycetaceae bacterium]|nr:DinB family protein [Planctomycetaceae bacterium]
MFESEITSNALLMAYAEQLIADIGDVDFVQQPLPGTNHPAWILCHLAMAGDGAVGLLGGEKLLPPDWAAKYGRDSKLSSERGEYPSREEIVGQFRATYARARDLAVQADAERMARPNPNARLRDNLPTIRDMCGFLLTGHLGVHLGQLSAWRRMRGLPPLF